MNKTKLDYEIVSKTRNVKPRVKDVDQTIRFKITGFDSYFLKWIYLNYYADKNSGYKSFSVFCKALLLGVVDNYINSEDWPIERIRQEYEERRKMR